MSSNPYQPPVQAVEDLSESTDCGCPCCGYKFTFADVAAKWPVRMICSNCSTRLVGNRFIKLQAVLIVPLVFLVIGSPLLLFYLIGHGEVLSIAAGIMLIAFTFIYVWATMRWGRYRVDA